MGDKTAYWSVRFLLFLSSALPKKLLYFLMNHLTMLFFYVSKRRREITISNLQYAFPSKGTKETYALAKEVYRELSKTITEILLMFSDKFDIDKSIVNKEEALNVLKHLSQHNKGRIVITAHFSNWELAAQFLAKHSYPMLAVGRKGDNALIDKNITIPFREKCGNKAVYKKHAAISIVKALKRGEIVGVLIDQKVPEKEGVKVQFFGRDVYTTNVVASMKKKLDITVLPIFLPRVGDGKYKLVIGKPVEEKYDIFTMTQQYNDIIESIIKEYPAQWLWMHNRWSLR